MFNRHTATKGPETQKAPSTFAHAEDPKSPFDQDQPLFTEGEVKEALGFAADDPNVHVRIMRGTGNPFADRELMDDILMQAAGDVTDTVTNIGCRPFPETGDEKVARLMPAISAVMEAEVYNEVLKAVGKHAPMHSPHEGWAVIQEELDELWDEVKADRGRMLSARKEAIQVAATAIRYLVDLDPR